MVLNKDPIVDAGADQSVIESSEVTLTASASDSDGTVVSYSWRQTDEAGNIAPLVNSDSATTTFTAPNIDSDTTLTFEITATDNDGNSTTDSVSILVREPLQAFNIINIGSANTRNDDKSGAIKQMTLTWGSPLASDTITGVTYTLCEYDASREGNCNMIVKVEDTFSVTVSVDSLLELLNNSYFVIAEYGSYTQSTSVKSIDSDELSAMIGYIKSSNTDSEDAFGVSVALSGDGLTLAVGTRKEGSNAVGIDGNQTDNSASGAGAVYLFCYDSDSKTWSQSAYLKGSNTESFDSFGASLALSRDGTTLVVGAVHEDSDADGIDGDQSDNNASNAGAVYIFDYNSDSETWTQTAYLKASNSGSSDYFGGSLALSSNGSTLAVGAYKQGFGNYEYGAVYLFSNDGGWSQVGYLRASNMQYDDYFGYALALSGDGNTLAVGAYREDSNVTGINGGEDSYDKNNSYENNNDAPESGAVYLFGYDNDKGWSQTDYIKASNGEEFDRFGYSVALDGDGTTLAVGALQEDSCVNGIYGEQDDNSLNKSGAAYLFTYDGISERWSQSAYIKASNPEKDDKFGLHVVLSGDGSSLFVSSESEGSSARGLNGEQADNSAQSAGAVYRFSYDNSSNKWSQSTYIKASNTGVGAFFGNALALSSDGDTLAVGAYYERSGATGINGDQHNDDAIRSGAVYLY